MSIFRLATASLVLVATSVASAGAEEDKNLPGVFNEHRIVTVMPPEPSDDQSRVKSFRVGNTEVRISGTITVDITAGDLKYVPRR